MCDCKYCTARKSEDFSVFVSNVTLVEINSFYFCDTCNNNKVYKYETDCNKN